MPETDPQPQQTSGAQSEFNPRPGTPVIANVYARPETGGGVKFSLKWRFKGELEDNERDWPIDIPEKKKVEPGTKIHFHLRDTTHRGFAFDPVHPIWVSRTQCPEDWSEDPEIPANCIDRHPNLLTVFDANKDACDLHFALVFEDRDGNREPYDPQIKNGGSV
jgi:hypothetical protein